MPTRLAGETSPYLLQHADNPVDWYPWGEEALNLARRENRPILLSIGYSACHWCHVMAHESFEDAATAAVMNRHFVSIKVDREERPDLDHIYQTAHQLLQQRAGGWPLTLFLTPDGTPFFGGTYFPKHARFGLPGFVELLEHVAGVFAAQRGEIEAQNVAIRSALQQTLPITGGAAATLDASPMHAAIRQLRQNFDPRWGGFGGAPKFPRPADLELLLRDDDPASRDLALTTLLRMAEGGIYDHLGGGFCRYSVDERWEIPHFEKMLYDNGPLLALYADAWVLTGEPRFRSVVEETAAWVMREMQSPEGGYWSALDADSEGEEGRFYVWQADAIRQLLSAAEYRVVEAHYGLGESPNFEDRAWHLRVGLPLPGVAARLGVPLAECETLLAAARGKLLAARGARVRPGLDDKVLASWNGLMIAGMAHAARVFGRGDWLASAQRALDFVRQALWRDGLLLATCRNGHAHLNAYLDDHAFLLAGLLELLQADFRAPDLAFARAVADALQARFEDPAGGFFFTSHDHEELILRPKSGHDNAMPSGNGVAAQALQRLALLCGEPGYGEAATRTVAAFWPEMKRQPAASSALLIALDENLRPPGLVVLRGPQAAMPAWLAGLSSRYLPRTMTLALPNASEDLPVALQKPESVDVNAWVCAGVKCLPPITDLEKLMLTVSKPGIVD